MVKKGKFIVFEGIDGSGSSTQAKLLGNHLEESDTPHEKIHYPDSDGAIGRLIYTYLDKKYNFPPEVLFMLYSSDMVKDTSKIKKWVNEGRVVIASRYIFSTLAYQCAQGMQLKKALGLMQNLDLAKPDAIVFVKISPETSVHRKFRQKGSLDRHESNEKLLDAVNKKYIYLSRKKVLGKWIVIDGEQPKDQVFDDIVSALGL